MSMLEKTVCEVFNEFTEEQKTVVYFLIGKASNKKFVETMRASNLTTQKELDQEIDEWKKANALISALTKAVIFGKTNKDCPLDFEIKFVRGDEK